MNFGINKKIIGCLLGGGVAVVAATVGGIKAKDSIDYKNKVNFFGKVRKTFNQEVFYLFHKEKGWYLPDWEDEEIWKEQYDRHMNPSDGEKQAQKEKFKNQYPTPEAFRDYCFEQAKKNLRDCDPTGGWCLECSRREDWTFEQKRAKK